MKTKATQRLDKEDTHFAMNRSGEHQNTAMHYAAMYSFPEIAAAIVRFVTAHSAFASSQCCSLMLFFLRAVRVEKSS